MNAHRPCPLSLRCLALLFVLVLCLESAFSGVLNISADFPTAQPTIPVFHSGITRLKVELLAESGKTIPFQSAQGSKDQAIPQIPTQPQEIPWLIRDRNGTPTLSSERTLLIQVARITVPPGGATVTLEIMTQHNDPEAINQLRPISVRLEQIQLPNTSDELLKNQRVDFTIEFSDTLPSPTGISRTPTPTDYYQLGVSVQSGIDQSSHLAKKRDNQVLQTYEEKYAFLLEDQWAVKLPPVKETLLGASPDYFILHTCDMFLPHKNLVDSGARLTRLNFSEMIENDLIPWMVTIYQQETNEWGFTWHPEWTSQRPEDGLDNMSVALGDGITWYHGPPAPLGNSAITLALSRRDSKHFDSIPDQVKTTFTHELFHNLQRSLIQHYQGKVNLDGLQEAWEFFSEGTAVLASTVGMTELEFSNYLQENGYLTHANYYISSFDSHVGLESLNSYQAGLYWRFLYEQCGGMRNGQEDPAAGMKIVNKSLEVLYQGEIMDIHTSNDLLTNLSPIMDQALAESNCPFHHFDESLLGFARAVNSLRWLEGREFYDPHGLYRKPPVLSLIYQGETITINEDNFPGRSSIPNSYGFDLIEIRLAFSRTNNLELSFQPVGSSKGIFNLQILAYSQEHTWKILASDQSELGETLRFQLDADVLEPYEWLNLIITRLDRVENQKLNGAYHVEISSRN